MMSHHRWLVVGGGIAGLSTALALARAGQPVHLLERAEEFAEIGAGLQIGANATRMMDRLGVLEQAEAVAVRPSRGMLLDAVTGEPLTSLTFGARYREHYGYPYLVMHRSDLLDILVDAARQAGVTMETQRGVTQVGADSDGARVTCADGSTYEADVLVGADGIRSRVRELIDTSEPNLSGYVAYRGTMLISDVAAPVAADDVVLWIGPGCHLVQYPVRRGEIYNQVAVFRSPRFAAGDADWGGPEELDEAFSGMCAPVRDAIAVINRDRFWPMMDRDPLPTWRHGRALLTGDAAHPMFQYLGQGACQSMEDAVCLAEQVTLNAQGERVDFDTAVRTFEQLRQPRTARCQLTARPWGELWHTTDPLTIGLRNRVLTTRAPDDYSDTDWLYAEQAK